MSLTRRLAIIAIFINIILLFFCPGIAFAGEYTGLRALLSGPMAFAPLLAFVFLIVGCVPKKETASSRAVCRVGLFIVAFSLASMAYCWDFAHNGVYKMFPDLQAADTVVEIQLGSIAEQDLRSVELNEADKAEVVALLQQATCRNPYASFRQIRADLIPDGSVAEQFAVKTGDGSWVTVGAWPPYYTSSYERGFYAADEEVCRQLADLYADLRAKYEPLDVAAVEE